MIVVATEEEYKLACKRFDDIIIKTGVGALNVIEKLKDVSRNIPIINFGYGGSNNIAIGTEVKIGKCKLYHPKVEYEEKEYKLNGDILCYTSNDFVTQTDITEPCIFDMELAYILSLGFDKVESIKIVSDNLSLQEYEKKIGGAENGN